MPRSLPKPSPSACHWGLDPGVVYLNHGSFGAAPKLVLEAQSAWRARTERDLVRWFVEEHHHACDEARKAIGAWLKCDWRGVAPVPNATIGVATVFANTPLRSGDEVLVTSHEYLACLNNARRFAGLAGATVVSASLPFPCPSAGSLREGVLRAVTPRTKVALLSHVTSSSGLVLPIGEIVRELESRGVATIVDGAHAPGMVPGIDLGKLGASYYTANLHKWLCAPKGSAFLFVREDRREDFRPMVLSNNAEHPKEGRGQFLTEFEYVGTNDLSAFYCIPDALRCMETIHPGGFAGVMAHNHALVLQGRRILCERLGVEPPAPEELVGSIATIVLPAHEPARRERLARRPTKYHDALWDVLLEKWRIQVPVWTVPGSGLRTLRISAQLYNSAEQYEYLAEALAAELAAEGIF